MNIKDGFAAIYEIWFQIYELDFAKIFDILYEDWGYLMLGLDFILIPLILMSLFYFVWKYPYGKFWHWLVWLIITTVIVAGTTYGITNNEIYASSNPDLIALLADPESGYDQFAQALPLKYALVNALLGFLIGFLYSLGLKQFSKIQIHLPF